MSTVPRDLIRAVYDAALDESLWPGVLHRIADLVHGSGAHLIGVEPSTVQPLFGWVGKFPHEADAGYRDYVHLDVRAERLVRRLPPGTHVDAEFISPEEKKRCPVHQEFLATYDATTMLANTFHVRDGLLSALNVFRPRADFDAADIQVLDELMPHVRKAVEIGLRFAALKGRLDAFERVADHLPFAMVLLDARSTPVFASTRAEDLLRRNDGLAVRNGRLTARPPKAAAALAAVISAASPSATIRRAGALRLARTGAAADYEVLVVPVPVRSDLARVADGAEVALFVVNSHERDVPDGALVAALYALTPAETRLALALLGGCDLKGYAEANRVTLSTVRTQLKAIFSKTGCTRQSEVVRLMSRLPVRQPGLEGPP